MYRHIRLQDDKLISPPRRPDHRRNRQSDGARSAVMKASLNSPSYGERRCQWRGLKKKRKSLLGRGGRGKKLTRRRAQRGGGARRLRGKNYVGGGAPHPHLPPT